MQGRLDSWKEIAAYLRRGARTVQRWEREEGLPVHRLVHEKAGSVYAYASELDAWWNARGSDIGAPPSALDEGRESVAVLPFADMSRERDQEYFCEGIAEEIVIALSRIKGLRVASRTSAFRFKPGATDVCEVGRRLRVQTLLEGSVRKADQRLRISVQLTDTAQGYQIWSRAYDREAPDIFAIQEEIANSVAEALEVSFTPGQKAALAKPPTRDVQAYECYLRGRRHFYGFGKSDMELAIQAFSQATAIDPEFALAYAGLADCWSYLYLYSNRSDAVREQADWTSARAVELDSESAQAHASRGIALSLSGRNDEADAALETALRLDSRLFDAHYFYARHSFAQGKLEKAVRHYEEAMRIRPEDHQAPLLVAQIYDDLGRPEDGRAARRHGIRNAEQHLLANPADTRTLYMAANGMVALGDVARGKEFVRRALAIRPEDPMVLYNSGCVYSMAGLVDDAIGCLEAAVEHGLTQRGWFVHDSNLDPLRQHPRFQKLLSGLP